MSEGPSAPHSTAAKAINKMSNNSWLAFSARGSSNFLKTFLNLPIRLPFRCGSRPQNPGFAPMQEKPQSHMRFPCPFQGEGARGARCSVGDLSPGSFQHLVGEREQGRREIEAE